MKEYKLIKETIKGNVEVIKHGKKADLFIILPNIQKQRDCYRTRIISA